MPNKPIKYITEIVQKWVHTYPGLTTYISVFFIAFIFYILYDNTPPHWDGGRHYYNSFRYWDLFMNSFLSIKENGKLDAISGIFGQYFFYPPLYYYVSIPFALIFGRTYDSILLSNIVWIILFIYSTYKLLNLFKFNRFGKVLPILFLLSSPFFIGQFRETMIDLPALAITLYLFYRLEVFIRIQTTSNFLFVAFSLPLTILTKWSTIIYLPLLLVLYVVRYLWINLKNKTLRVQRIIGYSIILIFGFMGGAGWWYMVRLTQIYIDLKNSAINFGIGEGDPQGIGLDSLLYYVKIFINEYLWMTWVLFITVAVSYLLFKNYFKLNLKNIRQNLKNHKEKSFLYLYGIVNFVLMILYFMNQSNKDARFGVIFYLSFIILFAFLGHQIDTLKNKKITRFYMFLAYMISMINLLSLALPIGEFKLVYNQDSSFPLTFIGNSGYTNPRTQRKEWKVDEALKKAGSMKDEYNNDICKSSYYWKNLATVYVDFESMPLHSNFGTVWGLGQMYGLDIGDQSSCFILVGSEREIKSTDSAKYKDYELVDKFVDSEYFNILLLKKTN